MPKIAFIADPLENFNPQNETTYFLMDEVCKRGWDCYHIELKDLYLDHVNPTANAKKIKIKKKGKNFSAKILNSKITPLAQMDAVFLRKDPPFDMNYFDHLSLLEILENQTLLINSPTGIKQAIDKMLLFRFHKYIPKTLISQNNKTLFEFVKKHKTAVLKPLNLSGGQDVIKVSSQDPSLPSMVDLLTQQQTRYIMAQEFVPAAAKGDKRILLLDGEILGSFLRVPNKKDFRGNLHSGAKLKKAPLTALDKKLVESLKPTLKQLKLYFVGLDLLGNKLTEINTTSPMGIGEINTLTNSHIEKNVVSWLQKQIPRIE